MEASGKLASGLTLHHPRLNYMTRQTGRSLLPQRTNPLTLRPIMTPCPISPPASSSRIRSSIFVRPRVSTPSPSLLHSRGWCQVLRSHFAVASDRHSHQSLSSTAEVGLCLCFRLAIRTRKCIQLYGSSCIVVSASIYMHHCPYLHVGSFIVRCHQFTVA